MIEQGNGPEPSEDKNEKDKDKKRSKRQNFFLSWLAAREGAGETDTPEDRGEKNEPKERFKFLRSLFKRHVLTEPVEPEISAPQEEEIGAEERWPTFEPYIEEKKEPELTLPVIEEASDAFETEAPAVAENSMPADDLEFKDYPLPTAQDMGENIRTIREAEAASPDSEPYIAPNLAKEEKDEKPETVVSRREPLAAATLLGLGAEYLGRKQQDRAQERKISNLERKTEAVEKRTDKLEMDTPRRTVRFETVPKPEKVQAEQKSNKEIIRPAKEKEKIAEEVAKKIEQYEKEQEAPTAVLKEMVKAAEAGVPVERIYERRQEVRDEPGTYSYGAAIPVSAVLRNLPASSVAAPGFAAYDNSTASTNLPVDNSQLYKEAAQRGFWGAIVIVIFMLMVYLFM